MLAFLFLSLCNSVNYSPSNFKKKNNWQLTPGFGTCPIHKVVILRENNNNMVLKATQKIKQGYCKWVKKKIQTCIFKSGNLNKRANWPIGILELSCQFLFFPAIRHTIVVHRMMNVEIKSFPKDSYTHWAWFAKLYCAWCLFTVFILIPLTRCSYFLMYFVVCVSFILILSFLFFFFSLSYFLLYLFF